MIIIMSERGKSYRNNFLNIARNIPQMHLENVTHYKSWIALDSVNRYRYSSSTSQKKTWDKETDENNVNGMNMC